MVPRRSGERSRTMDEGKRSEAQEALRGETGEPKQEERCKLAKDEVDGVAGGRPPVHLPPQ